MADDGVVERPPHEIEAPSAIRSLTRVDAIVGPMARWATGAKMFAILMVALFPLGLIAMIATLQQTRTADAERRALLRVAATESARALSIELVGDLAALRTAADTLANNPYDTDACVRLRDILALQGGKHVDFAIGRPRGATLCGAAFASNFPATNANDAGGIATQVSDGALLLALRSADRRMVAKMRFPGALLGEIGEPTTMMPGYALALVSAGESLPIGGRGASALVNRIDRLSVPLGVGDVDVEMSLSRVPLTAAEMVALLAPIMMWIAAALIAWLVTDRLLLNPLKRLRRDLVAYRPGQPFATAPDNHVPAVELRELGETFRRITAIVSEHEAGLARNLDHQTRLTREVHHRVKNNLQVIASLINLHARGARGQEAVRAYASIQRRVDALSVVHRNHFAESEVNRGLSLRSVIGELVSNIRATAPETAGRLSIQLKVDPLYATQDVAIAVAFLVTELVELAMQVSTSPDLTITLAAGDQPGRATLQLLSPSYRASARLDRRLAGSVTRVIEGLGRQLRSRLTHDQDAGSYAIEVAYTSSD